MKYQLQNGRNVTIDEKYLEKNMKVLHLTKEEAIQQWLEDEGYLVNEEQEALVQKTKGQKVKRDSKPHKKAKKVDETKKSLILFLNEYLINSDLPFENVTITNEQKIIEFDLEGNHYKLDLIKQRQSSKKEN